MITKFDNYINEGIRDKMTPKSEEDIMKDIKSGTPSYIYKLGIINNMIDVVKYAIEERGADVSVVYGEEYGEDIDPLELALRHSVGDDTIIKYLLDKGLDIKKTIKNIENGIKRDSFLYRGDESLLKYARSFDNSLSGRLKKLVLSESLRDKMTPKSEEDILNALQYTKSKEKEKTLVKACEDGDLGKVKLIIKSGVDIHYNSDEALRMAASEGEYEVTKFLLQNGANIDELIKDPIYYKLAKRFVSIRELIEDYKNK